MAGKTRVKEVLKLGSSHKVLTPWHTLDKVRVDCYNEQEDHNMPTNEHVLQATHRVDVVWSPDDDGWYLQEFDGKGGDRVSETFRTKTDALFALQDGNARWEDWTT